jgi:hypothetical protein
MSGMRHDSRDSPATAGKWYAVKAVARVLGSLRLALILLPLFAAALGLGIVIESDYGAPAAQQLVYNSWWLLGLIALLGVNILFAAVKKWPWKKHQTGFLITHVGLLTLVTGGLVGGWGVRGVMSLVDSEDPSFLQYGFPATNVVLDPARGMIRVRRPMFNDKEILYREFSPGLLPWNARTRAKLQTPSLVEGMDRLAYPGLRTFSMGIHDDLRLDVIDFVPDATIEPFQTCVAGDPDGFPAASIEFASPAVGVLPLRWLADVEEYRSLRIGPAVVEFVGRNLSAENLNEFLSPPTRRGEPGTLVVGFAGQTFRFEIDRLKAKSSERLGDTGWSVRASHRLPNDLRSGDEASASAEFSFELCRLDSAISFSVSARRLGDLQQLSESSLLAPSDFWAHFHPADVRRGDSSLSGVLQFATDKVGGLYFRSFANDEKGTFQAEASGKTVAGDSRQSIWPAMKWKFRVAAFLPSASLGIDVTPRSGLARSGAWPAILCRMSRGHDSKQFWLEKSDGGWTTVAMGDEPILVGYHDFQTELDFALRLVRAVSTDDLRMGSEPRCVVAVKSPDHEVRDAVREITFNGPLTFGNYKFHLARTETLGVDSLGQSVGRASLIVQSDPGLRLKYLGSAMVALGVACMFAARANYFGKRR